jgi:hypothetical protein
MEKGIFFHALYRLQQKLGRLYAELEPYSLYPVDEYFNGTRVHHHALPGFKIAATVADTPLHPPAAPEAK